MTTPKPATVHTQQANAPRNLGMDDRDIDRARQGLIAQHPTGVLEGPLGVAWDASRHVLLSDLRGGSVLRSTHDRRPGQ